MPTSARRFVYRACGQYPPLPLVRLRGDVGIAPYASGKLLLIRARFFPESWAPHPSGLRPATFPVGEGCLRRGTLYSSPSWTCRGPLHTRPGLCPVHPLPGEGFCFYSTPRRYRPLVQAPGSKLVGVRYSSRIRSTSRAFSVVKFSRMAQRPSLLRSFCRSSQ